MELTEAGRDEAGRLAARLTGHPWAAVVTSPLRRAADTARLAGFPAAVPDPDLQEWDYGADEGRTSAEIQAGRPGWTIWADGVTGGETIADVAARVDRVISRVRAREGDTLAFAHGHVLRILAARWLGEAPTFGAKLALGTGAVSVLGWEHEIAVIERWNEPPPGE